MKIRPKYSGVPSIAMQQSAREAVRPTVLCTVVVLATHLLCACSARTQTVVFLFENWQEQGTERFALTVTAAQWKSLGDGQTLNPGDHISRESVERVAAVIDLSLERQRLCPGAWKMAGIARSADGALRFSGTCDLPRRGTRT